MTDSGRDGARAEFPPVHFVCYREKIWPELLETPLRPIPEARIAEVTRDITEIWVQQVYYRLAMRGLPVSLGESVRPDAINVAGPRDFGRRGARPNAFVLIPRGDAHPPQLADFVLTQNRVLPQGPRTVALDHPPQPDITPRDPARGTRVECLAYRGRPQNLDAGFRAQAFRDGLAALGVAFELGGEAGADWTDYSRTDLVLAVRNLTVHDAAKKPASKLINAWLAEVPALLGPEPAFEELRESPDDFITVRRPEDALAAVAALKAEPARYAAMADAARRRKTAFGVERFVDEWVRVLTGPVAEAWESWKREPAALRLLRHAGRLALEIPTRRLDGYRATHGRRILDGS